jgi:tRNA modification GTPase
MSSAAIGDTIAAISTACGEAGIGIIRISGADALAVALRVFSLKNPAERIAPLRFYYGSVKDGPAGGSSLLDDGYLVYMKPPRSYTGEDTVELHVHGGALVLRKILESVLKNGARPALPGEFTKRAFLNGKLDLMQAEAVAEVIRAKTEAALKAARARLTGRVSKRINAIKETLADALARTEAELDFPEDGDFGEKDLRAALDGIEAELKALLSTYEEGKTLKEGVRCVILGRPNAGKSSVLNILLREERAIVTPLAGTTRDVIEEAVSLRGIPLRFMDTAGIREATDIVESLAVGLALKKAEEADIILYVLDSSRDDAAVDLKLVESLPEGKKVLVAANKMDIADGEDIQRIKTLFGEPAFISALKEEGMRGLEERIYELVTGRNPAADGNEEFITTVREKNLLTLALGSIEKAKTSLTLPREFLALDLKEGLRRLGEITGEVTTEDILERIFSTFCIGK